MIDYKIEHVCSFAVRGTQEVPPELIGSVPEGIRVNLARRVGRRSRRGI